MISTKLAVGRGAADDQPGFRQPAAVGVVDLEAVAVALRHLGSP